MGYSWAIGMQKCLICLGYWLTALLRDTLEPVNSVSTRAAGLSAVR